MDELPGRRRRVMGEIEGERFEKTTGSEPIAAAAELGEWRCRAFSLSE